MRVAIFGLGYVGTVSAACFAERGHHVIGVDVAPTKVETLAAGRSPIVEPGLDDLVLRAVQSGHLRATTNATEAVSQSDISFVCVGTPSRDNGSLNLDYVERVVADIAAALRDHAEYHVVVIRSTVLPGTVEQKLIPILERTSRRAPGDTYGVCMNPEFLREGTSIQDFYEPPKIVIGERDGRSGDLLALAYAGIDAPVVRTRICTAEMVKYADNAFHALKIGFANEIGNICKTAGTDGREVMDIFCLDTKLNVSAAYLKPGGAFGGSCLGKDLRALLYHAQAHDVRAPLLGAILPSNEEQKRLAFEMVRRSGKRRVGILGLSFKPDTDDLRESPAVELAETLIGKGFQVSIFDRNVSLARLIGSNRAYIEKEIPHISSVLKDRLEEVLASSDVLVITTRDREFEALGRAPENGRVVIDLAGVAAKPSRASYQGICW